MAVRDIVPIKYWFPKLNFNVRPGANQHFRAAYTTYSNDYTKGPWNTVAEDVEYDPDGNAVNSNHKLEFSNLAEDTEYVLRLIDRLNRTYDFKFKTGRNIALSDSPYYNKTLIPGQIYDWKLTGLDTVGLPTVDECRIYYKLANKKGVSIDTENWYSFITLEQKGDKLIPTTDDARWSTNTDVQGYTSTGFYCNNNEEPRKVMCFPHLKYNENTGKFETGKFYWETDGGGGIACSDILSVNAHIGFAFLVEEDSNKDQILCFFDTNTVQSLNSPVRAAWFITFTSDGHIKTTTINGTSETSVVDTTQLSKNTWYYLVLGTASYKLYKMHAIQEDGLQGYDEYAITGKSWNINGAILNRKNSNILTPFCIGHPDTDHVVICKASCGPEEGADSTFIKKVLNPDAFAPRVRMSGTTKSGTTWTYLTNIKFNTVITAEKYSLLISPNIFEEIEPLRGLSHLETGTVTFDCIVDGLSYATHTFEGFDYVDTNQGTTVHVGGLINNSTYKQESFDIKFAEAENPIELLTQYFFTKHGTWGGYNGGVNGHNIYVAPNGNIILESHGDKYRGSLKGVGKESDQEDYTGYGGDVNYDQNSWDNRTNKMCLRTGTALVSNKYFSYGRIDVDIKFPVGLWGLCPAIWLFHYIEVPDTDYRYKIAPYNERNEQGNGEDGFYRVVNNEIDIELPSHLTNGKLPKWSNLASAYFDKETVDEKLHIGVVSGTSAEKGLFKLIDPTNPNSKASWKQVSPIFKERYNPSYQNVKFNNWVGELNAGSGWCLPQMDDSGNPVTAEEYYKGSGEYLTNQKEEYMSQLLNLAKNENGFADGQFHKWSIVWLPDRTLLLVDNNLISENRGFVPFNQMKLTIAGWFPTMPVDNKKKPTGVKDRDGIHGTPGGVLNNIDDTSDTSIGTWAGTQATFEVCHFELAGVKYERYNVGDDITINGKTTHIDSEPECYGESFPESGLRMFVE